MILDVYMQSVSPEGKPRASGDDPHPDIRSSDLLR